MRCLMCKTTPGITITLTLTTATRFESGRGRYTEHFRRQMVDGGTNGMTSGLQDREVVTCHTKGGIAGGSSRGNLPVMGRGREIGTTL
jgi:hypothetical protein